jgi:hypothetical protein
VSGKRKALLKWGVLLVVFVTAFALARLKKDDLVREGANFLQNLLSRETGMDVRIGKISGKLNGIIRFDDVRLEDPALPEGLKTVFVAERIEFRYRPVAFLQKDFGAKLNVFVQEPQLYWRPSVGIQKETFPALDRVRGILLAHRDRLSLAVRGMDLFIGAEKTAMSGISLDYEDDHFKVLVPLDHYALGDNDLTTQIHLDGHLEWDVLKPGGDRVSGKLYTEGTVLDYKPLPWESSADFLVTREGFSLTSSSILGGFELTGEYHFENDGIADFRLRLQEYPLKNFEPFFGRGGPNKYDGALDLHMTFKGPLDAMATQADAMITGGTIGRGHYRSMVLHATGVYPTLALSDSHIQMEDGVQMRFAEKTVEFLELFQSRTYRNLITSVTQENVSMGDWGFKRPVDQNNNPEFLMERLLGDRARIQLRKYNETDTDRKLLEPSDADAGDRRDVEAGFQYRLTGEDSVKYTLREEGEQFVGVERKVSF